LRAAGHPYAGTDLDRPAAQDRARGRARQLDPRRRAALAASPAAAIKLIQRVRATCSAAPARYGGHRRPTASPTKPTCRLVAATPDLTLAELQTTAAEQHRPGVAGKPPAVGCLAAVRQLEALLRRAAARTRDALWSIAGRLLDACPAAECDRHLRRCG
jgi:hypothetical protein